MSSAFPSPGHQLTNPDGAVTQLVGGKLTVNSALALLVDP
jgi:hypothetical protein